MLSFEINKSEDAITVYCDLKGLDELINELTNLKSSPDIGHIHMRAPSSGGEILSDQNPWGGKTMGEVIVSLV